MIITHRELNLNNHLYKIFVHDIEGDEFATMYKDGQFHHKDNWNEIETRLANTAVNNAKNIDPIKTIWVD